ncbi:tetratricopeptide repeat protein [Allokutzneria sp. A3M-2-11 16]|uniref:ATP-binding protein n=1 Tax=Allokutzneria sp. A3M-2-11 16 TaxID=2962043 RepID=UPI0020B754A9|nr:XRE family transcriptional regulator [Allokutzneria sp. A3M-2-11 16]MCP3803661.1 tetratricopeptide repeat protein [Allokutzneria sp. A3M-2-11 16]
MDSRAWAVRLAERFSELKQRSGRSYDVLAKRAGISRSVLHRYCSGAAVPTEFGFAERFAKVCGADRDELIELHRMWVRASGEIPADPEPVLAQPQFDVPRVVEDFTGRETELKRLLAALPGESAPLGGLVISALDGMGGIGKTTLAVLAAHRMRERFPDGHLFIDLHAHTEGQQPLSAGAALDRLLRAVGTPGEAIPEDIDERAGAWRAAMAGRRALVVLDNAIDSAQVRPLLPGSPTCFVLITSRRRLLDLEGVRTLTLDVLTPEEATALFTTVAAVPDGDPVREAVRLCGYLPLAIRIAAARLRSRPSWTVEHLVRRLGNEHRRLAELQVGDRSVAATFSLSYKLLTTEQQWMFQLLGLAPGDDIDVLRAAALARVPDTVAEDLLESLVDAHLLQQPAPGRYQFHDLVRAYAADRAREEIPVAEREQALRRMFEFCVQGAVRAERLFNPNRLPLALPEPNEEAGPYPFATPEEALEWCETERVNLVASARTAAAENVHPYSWQLAWSLGGYLYLRSHWSDSIAVYEAALAATWRSGDRLAQSRMNYALGIVWRQLGRFDESIAACDLALAVQRAEGMAAEEAMALIGLADAYAGLGRMDEAIECNRRALGAFRAEGYPWGEALALLGLGDATLARGELTDASAYLNQAILLAHALHDIYAEGRAGGRLTEVLLRQGNPAEAVSRGRGFLALLEEVGDPWETANVLFHLGQAYAALGDTEAAQRHLRGAEEIFGELGDSTTRAVRESLLTLGKTPPQPRNPAEACRPHDASS